MPDSRSSQSARRLARVAGILYLLIIAIGMFGELAVRQRIVVPGDAASTAANLRSMEWLWRLGIAGEMVLLSAAIAVALILYFLLRPVSRELSLLAVFFNMVAITVEAVAALHLSQVLFPLGKVPYLETLPAEQLHALAALAARSHGMGFTMALLFFGFVCLAWGYLVFRSGYMPRLIGIGLAVAGLCYLVNSFAIILAPGFANLLLPFILLPPFLAESAFALWLLIKGVRIERWEAAQAASQSATA